MENFSYRIILIPIENVDLKEFIIEIFFLKYKFYENIYLFYDFLNNN